MKIVINIGGSNEGIQLTNIGFKRYAELAEITVFPQDRETEDGDMWWWTIRQEERLPMPMGVEPWMDFSFNNSLNKSAEYKSFARFVMNNTLNYKIIDRDDEALIATVEALGGQASVEGALVVREIPDGLPWKVEFDEKIRREVIVVRFL